MGHVIPLLKKEGLDPDDPSNYRLITNLSTISKILEKLALLRIKAHVSASDNFNLYKSAYREGHSTETALLKVVDDLSIAMDNKSGSILLSLDISAAFDMISHKTLLGRLHSDFGIDGAALKWLSSYLSERSCYISVGELKSSTWQCGAGVPRLGTWATFVFFVCFPYS